MSRKRRKRKKQRQEDPFSITVDIPKVEVPRIEIPKVEIPTVSLEEERKPDPRQLSKIQLVSILAHRLSENQIYRALIALGRQRLAQNFIREIELLDDKYRKLMQKMEGKVEEGIDNKILDLVVSELLSHMRRIYDTSFSPIDELDFHKQIEPFLNGLILGMENSLARFGLEVKVHREFELPTKERIDLLVSIGSVRIGIEVKYDLDEVSKLQRLLGQIDMYLPSLDQLIVVSYRPLDMRAIQMIKSKETEKQKPIKIVTSNQII